MVCFPSALIPLLHISELDREIRSATPVGIRLFCFRCGAQVGILLAVMLLVHGNAAVQSCSGELRRKSSRHTGDIKHPWRLTLSNGAITHDASFQTADEKNKTSKYSLKNKTYRYNIAASELAEMLGLDDALPVMLSASGMAG